MKAVILAAGKGTRMRPLTYGIPKPLLPVKGKPMLEWVIGSILHKDIDEIIIAIPGTVGDDPEERTLAHIHGICIDNYLKNMDFGVKIKTVATPLRETGGDLRFVLEESGIKSGEVVVVYGDNLTHFDFGKMVEYHKKCKKVNNTQATVLLFEAPKSELHRFGIAKIKKVNGLDIIEYFVEKPKIEEAPSNLANGGYYIIEVEDVLKKLPHEKKKVEHSLFPELAKEGKLAGFITKLPYWIDISTVKAYEEANKMAHDNLIISPPISNGKNNSRIG